MPKRLAGSNIEVPAPGDPTSCGGYTGFNSADLQAIYRAEKVRAERYQIARGYGKPVLARLPDGEVLASGFYSHRHEPDYTYPDGRRAHDPEHWWLLEEAALMRSPDEGRTWSPPRLLGLPGRVTTLNALADGTLFLTCGDALHRSDDRGHTWRACEVDWDGFAPPDCPQRGFGETNGVLVMPDRSLVLCCHALKRHPQTVRDWNAYLIRSTDQGRRWSDASLVTHTDEVSLILDPQGELVAFPRVDTQYARDIWGVAGQTGEGGDTVTISRSADAGRTWSEPRRIGLGMAQVPAFPLWLADGRLLLSYGNRQFPFGCQAVASRDGGETWVLDQPLLLSWFSWDNYGGHPRSLLLPDGSILTGYYVRMFKEDPEVTGDLASHVVRWRPPADWPRVSPTA
ncbi:MAG: hypothetical protein AB1505_16240 [Candidatus Latescibacterota bacterium]